MVRLAYRTDSHGLRRRKKKLRITCIEVLTQVSAATRALQAVALQLLGDHLGHCVQDALAAGGPDAQAKHLGRMGRAPPATASCARSATYPSPLPCGGVG